MNAFRLSPEASQDIIEIYEYIAQDSIEAAERVRMELLDAMRGLAQMPGKGHRREDLTKWPVLFWTVRSYQNHLPAWRRASRYSRCATREKKHSTNFEEEIKQSSFVRLIQLCMT